MQVMSEEKLECRNAFLKEAARLEYTVYWDSENERPLDPAHQVFWSWFMAAWNQRQSTIDKLKETIDFSNRMANLDAQRFNELQERCK